MTMHRFTITDMRNDLDEFVKYSREFKDDVINVNMFMYHMHFLYEQIEKLNNRLERIEDNEAGF